MAREETASTGGVSLVDSKRCLPRRARGLIDVAMTPPAPVRFLMIVSGYPPAKTAGMERGCQRMAEALVRRGHAVIVLTQSAPGGPAVAIEEPGVEVRRVIRPLALGALWGVTYMAAVMRHAAALRARWDFALCHEFYLHSAAMARLGRWLGRPTATLLVNGGTSSDVGRLARHRGGRWLVAEALRADAQFALSRVARADLLAAGANPRRLYNYHYFVDTARFSPAAEPPHEPLLVYVGRLHPQKNIPLLLDVFARVHRHRPDARLLLVGRGPAEDNIRARIGAHPAAAAITLQPWTDDPAAVYRRAWAVVTATNAEGLSNVLIEAMACGAPVVTTDVSGAREVLDPADAAPSSISPGTFYRGAGGHIAAIGDAAGLTAGFLDVLSPERRHAMAAAARRRVEEAFSESACIDGLLLPAVADILRRHGARRP